MDKLELEKVEKLMKRMLGHSESHRTSGGTAMLENE